MSRLDLAPQPWENNVQKNLKDAPQRLAGLRDAEVYRMHAVKLAEDQRRRDAEAARIRIMHLEEQHQLHQDVVAAAMVQGYWY